MTEEKNEKQNQGIELFSYDPVVLLLDVLKKWYLIVVVAVLVGMATYVLKEVTYQPQYSTTTTFVVSSKSDSATVYQNLSATTELAKVFSEVLNSSILRQTINEELQNDEFHGAIQAEAVPETNLLTMTVSDHDPRKAFLVTRTIIEKHSVVTKQILGDTVLDVLQKPVVPTNPSNPLAAGHAMKKAVLYSGFAMCLLSGIKSCLRDTVRSKREAEEKLDERVLAVLRHERKIRSLQMLLHPHKTSILVSDPVTSFSYVENVRKMRRQVEQRMEGGKSVLLTSVLENEGKSTVAVNLAMALAQKQKKVLLIDADLRRPACYKVLEQKLGAYGTAEVALGRCQLAQAVIHYNKVHHLDLLLESGNQKNAGDIIASDGMKHLVEVASEEYDYVILDTPPMSVVPDAEALAEMADASLLVIRQNATSTKMLSGALDVLNAAKGHFLGCVLNNVYTSVLTEMSGDTRYGYGYGYGYGHYSHYDHYGHYGHYGRYGDYQKSHSRKE